MRSLAWALLLSVCFVTTAGREPARRVIDVSTAGELMAAFEKPLEDVTVRLAPGRYVVTPREGYVPTRGACPDSSETIQVKFGLVITGKAVQLIGPDEGEAVIVADAGYRLHFKNCTDCALERVTITGESPSVGAAVYATDSRVRVRNCEIDNATGNPGWSGKEWRGTANGIEGARNARLEIQFNEIRNSTAGVVLHRNAHAVITNNLIEGFGGQFGGWGIWVLCEATAVAERNRICNVTAGVELDDDSSLDLRANIIEDAHDEGISGSRPGLGRVRIEKNVLYRCGRAGIVLHADGDQKASLNLIVATGLIAPDSSAIRIFGARADAAVRRNTLYDNVVLDESLDRDVSREVFWRARRQWTRTYRNTPVGVDGRHMFHESAFLTRYGRWMD